MPSVTSRLLRAGLATAWSINQLSPGILPVSDGWFSKSRSWNFSATSGPDVVEYDGERVLSDRSGVVVEEGDRAGRRRRPCRRRRPRRSWSREADSYCSQNGQRKSSKISTFTLASGLPTPRPYLSAAATRDVTRDRGA